MIPFLVHLYKEQLSALKKLAKANHQSVAKEIRDGIDEHLALNKPTLMLQRARLKQSGNHSAIDSHIQNKGENK